MNPAKITLLSISLIIVLFLLYAALYDIVRCLIHPETYFYVPSKYPRGTSRWYFELFTPNIILIAICLPKIFIMKKFSTASEQGSIWNPIFYFAFTVVIVVGAMAVVEIFDTPNIEIIENV